MSDHFQKYFELYEHLVHQTNRYTPPVDLLGYFYQNEILAGFDDMMEQQGEDWPTHPPTPEWEADWPTHPPTSEWEADWPTHPPTPEWDMEPPLLLDDGQRVVINDPTLIEDITDDVVYVSDEEGVKSYITVEDDNGEKDDDDATIILIRDDEPSERPTVIQWAPPAL